MFVMCTYYLCNHLWINTFESPVGTPLADKGSRLRLGGHVNLLVFFMFSLCPFLATSWCFWSWHLPRCFSKGVQLGVVCRYCQCCIIWTLIHVNCMSVTETESVRSRKNGFPWFSVVCCFSCDRQESRSWCKHFYMSSIVMKNVRVVVLRDISAFELVCDTLIVGCLCMNNWIHCIQCRSLSTRTIISLLKLDIKRRKKSQELAEINSCIMCIQSTATHRHSTCLFWTKPTVLTQ